MSDERRMTYSAVTVTLEKIDGIVWQRDQNGTRIVGVDFNVTVAGKRHYAVRMRGSPRLDSGMVVTAVLRDPDNWQTLIAWLNHTTGEVCGVNSPGTEFAKWAIVLLVSSVYGWEFFRGLAGGSAGVAGGVVFGVAAVVLNVWTWCSWRKAARVYRMLRP